MLAVSYNIRWAKLLKQKKIKITKYIIEPISFSTDCVKNLWVVGCMDSLSRMRSSILGMHYLKVRTTLDKKSNLMACR